MPRAKKPTPDPVAAHQTGAPQPAVAPTGLPYGERKAAIQAQRAVPQAGPTPTQQPAQLPGPSGPSAAPPDQPPAPADPAALLQAAHNYDAGPPVGLGPTARPGEPVTAGLPVGPGPGPEALGMPDPNAQDIQAWRPYLPGLEYLASMPNSTQSTRNFVRRLRATMPPATSAPTLPPGATVPTSPPAPPPGPAV